MPTQFRTGQLIDDCITGDKIDFSSAWQADWSAGTNKLTNLVAGTAPTDAVNVSQLDSISAGLDPKESVRATTVEILDDDADITGTPVYDDTGGTSTRGQITGTLAVSGVLTIDDVTLVDGDRLLIKNEGDGGGLGADANGIWIVGIAGTALTLDRATDFDEDDEVTAGAYMFTEEGTANGDIGFVLITDDPITIGGATGTGLSFTQFSGASSIIAGAGLDQSGNTIFTAAGDTSMTINADSIQVNLNGTFSGLETSSGLRISTGAAGNGLTGGGTTALAALADPTPATITVAAAGISVTDPLLLSDNDASTPTYSFSSDPNTGMYNTGTSGELAFSSDSTERMIVRDSVDLMSNTALSLFDSDNTQAVSLAVVANVTGNYTITFPAAGPSADDIAQFDASGNISFVNLQSDLGFVDGTGVANQVAFWSDTDTLAGDADFTFDGTNVTITNPILGAAGILTNPTYSFTLDPNTGIFNPSADALGFVANSIQVAQADAAGLTVFDELGLVLRENDANGTAGVTLKAVADLSGGSYTLTLPPDDGTAADQVLRTDGAGITTWVTVDAGLFDSATFGDGLELNGSAMQVALVLDTTSSGGGLTGVIDGANKVYTTSATPNGSLPVLVYLNGQLLDEGASEDFTRSGTAITLTANQPAPVTGDKLHAIYYDS